MTDHKARQPKGIFTGGQFDAAGHAESHVSTEAPSSYATAADVMATRREHLELIYVHYDEQLTNDQIDSILAGDWAGAEDAIHEAYEEHAYLRVQGRSRRAHRCLTRPGPSTVSVGRAR
jgi:hypothetical protein